MKKLISVFMAVLFALSLITVAAAEGQTFTGIVTYNAADSFTVVNAYGSQLTFSKGKVPAVPAVGSTITVAFSGDLSALPVAESVTVENAAVVKTASGTVKSVTASQFVLETADSVLLTVTVTDGTKIKGKANKLAAGQTVSIIYTESSQFVTVINLATEIEITAVKAAETKTVEVTVDEKKTTNKKVSGTVTKLTSSKITVKTSKGRTWTFRRTNKTSYSGKYELKTGCTVTVYYDGYASQSPNAKKIKVTKAASTEPTTHTKKGTCEYFGGMMIGLTNGFEADVAYAKHSGSGYRGEGTQVKVTYYTKNGCNYATRIKWYAE